jgi:hypothetical protein
VLQPYINGKELNSIPDLTPPRYVINFGDRSEKEAEAYPYAIERVRVTVKPQRDVLTRQIHETCYWKHWDKREKLYGALSMLKRAIVCSFVSKHLPFVFLPTNIVFSKELVVIPSAQAQHFALLQCTFHSLWARAYSGTLKSDLSYSISDAFRTYPGAAYSAELDRLGETYHETRRQIMLERWEGLTATYNRFHNPKETSADIAGLRDLHRQMDEAVALAYGWPDLDLGHGFHDTAQGTRYTIAEPARREVLKRLLALNHERYAEEVAKGLHDKKKGGGKRGKKKAAPSAPLPLASSAPASGGGFDIRPYARPSGSQGGAGGGEGDEGDDTPSQGRMW